ncbi:family 43 glycosylhydrolase [Lacticaseibacillus manihotivorans]|jgi:hypothetical protein|uniref:Uncharacterized protein n=2 Tax=Lacticaseibacillus manihotivorans TaxID=88233 RepID=A0A0R1QKN3_9LACO|nr:family 43 glycosylhydrolase [Lacticaseibacillus manihotivorans]KRL45341.1 hypothetical protein FD01_GL000721 [Lacticaseibacillus manihotivorans DSM 13343 = JCM 12514]QFQ91662.1 family 43 glycosylhydrolase [Lacticaseibacillus manihotivorans]
MNSSFHPGKVWLDNHGDRIQAHGGSVLFHQGKYYWYGENKEKTTGQSKIWHWGVRCYSSTDLYNWDSEGIIIPPDLSDPHSPLYPESMMDRPHIIYNPLTHQFVAWLKVMGERGSFAILTADAITGPYTLKHAHYNPCGLDVGDFDLTVEADRAYLISQKPHQSVYIADLDDTYTEASGYYTEHLHRSGPPFAREAPAYFKRGEMHYLLTSGTTGYHPNPSELVCAQDIHGPYRLLTDPHVDDHTDTSFNSQISSVLKVAGKDLYIAIADRWVPNLAETEGEKFSSGEGYAQTADKFKRMFDPSIQFELTAEDLAAMRINSSISDYVWLPISFESGQPQIIWQDEWQL